MRPSSTAKHRLAKGATQASPVERLLPDDSELPSDADNTSVRRVISLPLFARNRGETGASLVEFSLVLPVFMMLLLGMLTGGLAYSRKLSVAQGAREGARYGATLPITAALPVDTWLTRVANVTIASSDAELAADRPGQALCVAHVASSGTARSRQQTGTTVSFADAPCIVDDGRAGETRVQVVARRSSRLEVLLFSRDLDLSSRAVARFEAQ